MHFCLLYHIVISTFLTQRWRDVCLLPGLNWGKLCTQTDPPYLWCHVVGNAELQVADDALHAVVSLLPGCTKVLLHGPRHGGKYGLSCLPGVHHLPRVFGRRSDCIFLLMTFDVGKSFFYCHHQPVRIKETMTPLNRCHVHYKLQILYFYVYYPRGGKKGIILGLSGKNVIIWIPQI